MARDYGELLAPSRFLLSRYARATERQDQAAFSVAPLLSIL